MPAAPKFASIGTETDTIDVRLSYKIVKLFSEGLYASPNKAIEELVANSFDAGAQRVAVLHSANLHAQAATIAVVDDGQGMDVVGLKQHWLIGVSNKRRLAALPRGRQQIGQFGIGKLATYVLANRLTHLTKLNGKFYSASMDYTTIDRKVDAEVEPKSPVRIPLRELTEAQAKQASEPWTSTAAFKNTGITLFGKGAAPTWTISAMSSLKPKVHEIKPGILEWVLRTALPLRPDFKVWLNGVLLASSKEGKGLLKRWVLGKDLKELPKPGPKNVKSSEDKSLGKKDEHRFGLDIKGLGRVTGYVEAYQDLLTGKSDDLGRSYGFFVYVLGRLINVVDGHFGIPPNELRHGTFGRFRLVVHMDGLDSALRSNREGIEEGPLLSVAQDVLRAIFNAIRPTLEKHDSGESPGKKLARKVAASPSSLSRAPIVELARKVIAGKASSRFLIVPTGRAATDQDKFIKTLEQRAKTPETFLTGLTLDYSASSSDSIAQFDTIKGQLRVNAWHPFVATFYDEFASRSAGQPLELLTMAEVLAEAQLHELEVPQTTIAEFLTRRDQLLRSIANESGRKSSVSVANELLNSRNSPRALEVALCDAFRSLGYEVTPLGRPKEPEGVAAAHLSAGANGLPRGYQVSLEAKSKLRDGRTVSAKAVGVSTIGRQRDAFSCEHAVVVAPAFPTSHGEASSLAVEIAADRRRTIAESLPKTITCIRIDDLAMLVKLRPVKQIGLQRLRDLFQSCSLPEESAKWVESIRLSKVAKPPYKIVVATIAELQKKYRRAAVKYPALRVELSHHTPAVDYETDDELVDLCKAMAQMAPGAVYATNETVELDQSELNVLAAIEAASKESRFE